MNYVTLRLHLHWSRNNKPLSEHWIYRAILGPFLKFESSTFFWKGVITNHFCVFDILAASPFAGPMMHQQPPSQQYNMPQAGGQHYQGQQPPMGMMGQVNQGNHMMGQRQIPPYRPPQQGRNSLQYFYTDFK